MIQRLITRGVIRDYVRETRVEWTNWTFGVWWGNIGRNHCIGIDAGPLQIQWMRDRKEKKI